jgi:hypothetical protein
MSQVEGELDGVSDLVRWRAAAQLGADDLAHGAPSLDWFRIP